MIAEILHYVPSTPGGWKMPDTTELRTVLNEQANFDLVFANKPIGKLAISEDKESITIHSYDFIDEVNDQYVEMAVRLIEIFSTLGRYKEITVNAMGDERIEEWLRTQGYVPGQEDTFLRIPIKDDRILPTQIEDKHLVNLACMAYPTGKLADWTIERQADRVKLYFNLKNEVINGVEHYGQILVNVFPEGSVKVGLIQWHLKDNLPVFTIDKAMHNANMVGCVGYLMRLNTKLSI